MFVCVIERETGRCVGELDMRERVCKDGVQGRMEAKEEKEVLNRAADPQSSEVPTSRTTVNGAI